MFLTINETKHIFCELVYENKKPRIVITNFTQDILDLLFEDGEISMNYWMRDLKNVKLDTVPFKIWASYVDYEIKEIHLFGNFEDKNADKKNPN